uniref:JAB1/Mov34/MPN/PAD-1 ubiquitin protease n=1 Tax=Candidatus Kentrum sp. TC TaxID=2126339 RepID=A0A450YWQ5_9GAMM|nr:MAG: JAB1/Mov34/MPN/PAD-1 ubiquitin protease [Candidatus Kentron sp. TC]
MLSWANAYKETTHEQGDPAQNQNSDEKKRKFTVNETTHERVTAQPPLQTGDLQGKEESTTTENQVVTKLQDRAVTESPHSKEGIKQLRMRSGSAPFQGSRAKEKKFTIVSTRKAEENWIPFRAEEFGLDQFVALPPKKHSPKNSDFELIVLPSAVQSIFKHIRWGCRSCPDNEVEQGGLLLGKLYVREDTGKKLCVAEKSIEGRSARGAASYLNMTHETWKEMLDSFDEYKNVDEELRIIGWYHTHPNNLGVFFSDTDMNTQKTWFKEPWHFGIVLNPQKRVWTLFYGPDSKPGRGMLYLDQELEHSQASSEEQRKFKVENEQVAQPDEPVAIYPTSIMENRRFYALFALLAINIVGTLVMAFMVVGLVERLNALSNQFGQLKIESEKMQSSSFSENPPKQKLVPALKPMVEGTEQEASKSQKGRVSDTGPRTEEGWPGDFIGSPTPWLQPYNTYHPRYLMEPWPSGDGYNTE